MSKYLLRGLSISLLVVGVFATGSFAQKVYTPEKGSAERAAILNALRVPVEKELKQKIQFRIDDFNVLGSWAFVSGSPQDLSGGMPDYSGTDYQEQIDFDAFDNNFFALLKKSAGKWKVTTYAIGCTDVCYAGWWKTYKAPKAVFPYTE